MIRIASQSLTVKRFVILLQLLLKEKKNDSLTESVMDVVCVCVCAIEIDARVKT